MEDGTEENNLNELFVQETLDPRIESVMPILNRIHKKVSESVVDKEMNKLAEWADSLVEEGGESLTSNNPIGIPESETPTHKGGAVSSKNGVTQHKSGPGVYGGYDANRHPDSPEEKHVGSRGAKTGHRTDKVVKHKEVDESALQAYLGDKKYGEKGMDALRKAGREHASKTKMQNIRAKFSNKEENVTEYGPSATAALQQGQHPIQVAAADRKDQENTLNVNRAAMKAQQDVAKGLDPTQTAAGQTAAGNDVAEGTGSSIERILAAHPEAVENFKQGGDLDYDLESDLWEYYFNNGEIRNYDADASEFISQRLADELGLSEGLDANQKRVGQLGPTEKVKNNNIGKLVGANENFINTVDQAVVSEEDEMAESILSAIKKVGKKVLDKVAPGDEELLKQLDKDAHGGKLPNRYNSDAESAKKYPADSWKVKVDESSDELARILTIMNHKR
jgi:hypothetical protein